MILYLIPARGGSKRLPGKNLRKLAGIPLVAWAIRRAQGAARLVGGESRIVVSTDSEEIAAVSLEWGAEVLIRPARYAADDASSEDVLLHARNHYQNSDDAYVLVQPTSPLALPEDIAATVRAAVNDDWHAVTVVRHDDYDERRNGAAYAGANGRLWYRDSHQVEMPESRSVDIDTEDDWHMAEALLAARSISPFEINGRKIGPGHPCFIIAEAGINHGGDSGKAHDLVDAAADSGADAVKFQAYMARELAEKGPHCDLLYAHQLSEGEYAALKRHAEERGLIFLCSVFDRDSADLLERAGVPAFKIPSGEIINLPLLRHVASKGKPVILSTGMSTMREVAAAVDALEGVPLALLHCVSEYPQHPDVSNIRAMDMLRQAFGVPVGWSDHTTSVVASMTAVARGACIVERHLMLDGPAQVDWSVSLRPGPFASFVKNIRRVETALGSGEKVPTAVELETAKVARRREGLRRNA